MHNWLLLVVVGLGLNAMWAQDTIRTGESSSWQERMFFVGNLGMGFAGSRFYLGADPGVGYRITDQWHAGLQLSLNWISDPVYSYTLIGPMVFTRYFLIPDVLFVQAEGQQLRSRIKHKPTQTVASLWHPAILLGGGLATRTGNFMLYLLAMYDVLQHPNSLYYGTNYLVIRMGFAFY